MLQGLVRDAPALPSGERLGEAEAKWLGRADALLSAFGQVNQVVTFRVARENLGTIRHDRNSLMQPLYDALSHLELLVPAELQGAFIRAGDTWNGYAALVQIVQRECKSLFIVDPYMDASVFMDLVPHMVAKQSIRILTARQPPLLPALIAASNRWNGTRDRTTPDVETRLAPSGRLHDRLIIVDGNDAWLVSQSLKDIAKKSPASVTRADVELAKLKATAYDELWLESRPLA